MLEVLVRKMLPRDVNQIMEIECVSFGQYHWSSQAFVSEINNKLGNYITIIDKKTQKVIGYGGFWLIFDEAHITTIAVHPDYRKNSLGELLLLNMIELGYKNNAKWFTLEVRASNIAAQNLYYKYGFKSLGLRKKYYQDNEEDALIMWTENIWDAKFKEIFQQLKDNLANKQTIAVGN
ncbi:MAG: ribosomal-protein-alanine N-acetyltransferase [Candidatus Melainabacteria bacterium GWF2_32_7]|nr:MAG: ribosomal-protein-alanine N-acetyltransferase [Candidatus Melainabacteria bacterium GWF2_32_7]